MTDTTTAAPATVPARVHVFEAAGLGPAPYKFLGVRENRFVIPGHVSKPGGSCRYCGNGILWEFHLRAADGRTFHVGSECIRKAGDAGLRRVVLDHEREQRQKKAAAVRQRVAARLAVAHDLFVAQRATFEQLPHPRGFVDRQTGRPLTLADQIEWTFKNAGQTGQLVMARVIEQTLGVGK